MVKFVVLLLVSLSSMLYSQELSKYYQKIDRKIEQDENYLDIYSIQANLGGDDLQNLPDIIPTLSGNSMKFIASEDYTYYFVFLQKSMWIDSLTLLRVELEQSSSQETRSDFFGGATTTAQEQRRDVVLSFADLNELYFSSPGKYNQIANFIYSSIGKYEPISRLNLPIEEYEIDRGVSSPDNTDYLNFMWVNSSHHYPKDIAVVAGEESATLSPRARRKAVSSTSEYIIDASFHHASFFHKEMDFDFTILGAELSMDSELLNLHPWQSMALKAGVRGLFFITGDKKDLKDNLIADLKLMGRFAVGSEAVADAFPFVFSDKPKLNISTGLVFDLHTTRYYHIPFFNLYFATGGKNFENPSVSFGNSDSSYAYFNFNEFESSFSFYWNSNKDKEVRLRMDVGVGSYSIVKAIYNNGTTTSEEVFSKIMPLLNFYVNFIPEVKRESRELFALNLRLFDSILKADFWLKILELEGGHTFRLETGFISSPLYRSNYEWENSSSTMIGVRYRYGF